MENQNNLPEDDEVTTENKETIPSKLSRRGFLQAALVSAAAATSAGTLLLTRTNEGQSQTATSTPTPSPTPNVTSIKPAASLQETWIEPWVWRPADWNGQQLDLNVVENQNPGPAIGLGNIDASLFSYGGITPGPTIRMRGDETLFVKLRNFLGKDFGTTFVKEYPDPAPLTQSMQDAATKQAIERGQLRHDFCIGEHTNGIHSNHVTNLHTHGLHVRPGKNIDGTQSDNIILRVMSHNDYRARQESDDLDCLFLLDREQVGEADYEFILGNVMGNPDAPHPPGTHWYHPHSHGATHNQVSSGMAGFLIVEGDVDESINRTLTKDDDHPAGIPNPDPQIKTGKWDYRERLMLVQRVSVNPSTDKDAPLGQSDLKKPTTPNTSIINGSNQPKIMTMRPGAVERWRILNGSVDGRGFKRFMVLEGEFVTDNKVLKRVNPDTGNLLSVSPDDIVERKQQLYQLAMDGVTLVNQDGEYRIKDLANQNPNAIQYSPTEEPTAEAALAALQACFADETSVKDCYVRPNEVYMAPANRADVFFQAPRGAAGTVFTVVAKAVVVHGDNFQASLQGGNQPPPPGDIIVAYIAVSGTKADVFDVLSLNGTLPKVPDYLMPIREEELVVGETELDGRNDVEPDHFRTRSMSYSGWGAADFPLVYVPDEFVEENPDLEHLTYSLADNGRYFLLPPNIRTMAINARFDLSSGTPPPRKFDPMDPNRAQMLVDSAEEWAIYNNSISLWGDVTESPPVKNTPFRTGYPILRAEGQERHAKDNNFQILTKAVDHPFHIHINPFYVLRIEVPDENGNLINILDEPRWQDVIWLPRNGGRVVFRSRFPDFIGQYVNHCHILLHEDNGMMHVVQTTQYAEDTNYVPKSQVASFADSEDQVNEVYPRPSLEESYLQSISFVDPNPATGQTFPGFKVEPPVLDY